MSNDIIVALDAVAPEAQTFGEAVRRLRTQRGLTQEKLAQASDLTTNYVSDIERGRTMVSLNTILKLSFGLDCIPADLLSDFTSSAVRKLFR
jgi:transcriptional regulator with XRE-family HTH domain